MGPPLVIVASGGGRDKNTPVFRNRRRDYA